MKVRMMRFLPMFWGLLLVFACSTPGRGAGSSWLEETPAVLKELVYKGDISKNLTYYKGDRPARLIELRAQHLRYEVQPRSQGALYAIKHQVGDCTEYAALFAALARAGGIPARFYSGFTMGDQTERTYRQPNHTFAEAYLAPMGWIPIDPNLGRGQFSNDHSFGRTANNVIYLKREGAWVYSRARGRGIEFKDLPVEVSWTARFIDEGAPHVLLRAVKRYR